MKTPTRAGRWVWLHLAFVGVTVALAWASPTAPLDPWVRSAVPALTWFLLPLTPLVISVVLIGRKVGKGGGIAWQLVPALLAGMVLGYLAQGLGDNAALSERGRWITAKVVAVDDGKARSCTLRHPSDPGLTLEVREGSGCTDKVRKGDPLRVVYDPAGAVEPKDTVGGSATEIKLSLALAVLAGLYAGFATWGCVSMTRKSLKKRPTV